MNQDSLYIRNVGTNDYRIARNDGTIVMQEPVFTNYSEAKERLTALRIERATKTPDGKKRTREVFPTDELPHLWAHHATAKGRNAHGNLFFEQGTIYSYGSHFPIASHVVNRNGESAVLLTNDRYSVTTAKHVHAVSMAIPSKVTRFEFNLCRSMVPYGDGKLSQGMTDAIIAEYQRKVRSIADDAIASRTAAKIGRLLDEARAELAELQRFVTFFGLPALSAHARIASRKLPYVPDSVERAKDLGRAAKQEAARIAKAERERKAAEHLERAKAWMESNPEYAARWDGSIESAESLFREHEAARQRELKLSRLRGWMAERPELAETWNGTLEQGESLKDAFLADEAKKRNAETIAAWLRGEQVSTYGLYDVPTMLRIRGNDVETSHGARFPVSHAVRGLQLVIAVRASGREWRTNGHTCHLGHYQIDRITPDGTVYAGCHVVTWEAIERIMDALMTAPIESEAVQA